MASKRWLAFIDDLKKKNVRTFFDNWINGVKKIIFKRENINKTIELLMYSGQFLSLLLVHPSYYVPCIYALLGEKQRLRSFIFLEIEPYFQIPNN